MRANTRAMVLSSYKSSYKSVNLVSSESEDEAVLKERVGWSLRRSPACRQDLYCSQTTLTDTQGVRLDQVGLFTKVSLPVGAFICMYNGDWYDSAFYESMATWQRERLDEFAIQTEDSHGVLVVAPPLTGVRPHPV